jgi:hypothetical protein
MKKYSVICALALTCFTLQAAFELDGVRYGGYTTNAVPAGFSILAVPFGGFNTNSFATTNLSLEALISTNGLAINDRLIAFDEATTNYYYYVLESSGWTPLNVTQIGSGVTNEIKVVQGPALSGLTKAQGFAFWLQTQNATTAYLQGVVDTNDIGVAIAANAFTLVGNALPSELLINSVAFTNANPWFAAYSPETGPGDEIHVVDGTNYIRNVFIEGRWKKNSGFADSDNVPVGAGLWFLRRGNSQTFKLK